MDYALVWSGFVAASIISLNLLWSVIEQPFMQFLALGIVPGTQITMSYEQILMIGLSFFSFWLLLEHLSHTLNENARIKSLDLSSL